MRIHEAVKQAIEASGRIRRTSTVATNVSRHAEIVPTNSYDTCILTIVSDGEMEKSCRCWNPTADDLMAEDWEVVTE